MPVESQSWRVPLDPPCRNGPEPAAPDWPHGGREPKPGRMPD